MVLATSPANLDASVPLSSAVTVAFSEPMDPATITTGTFLVTSGGTPVAGTVSYADAAATFTPDAILAGGLTYTATVKTGVADAAGNALATEYTWTFAAPAPHVAYVTNKNDATVSIYWADAASGRLYPRGHVEVAGGRSPIAVTVDPSRRFAVVANYGDDSNPTTGSVTTFRINGVNDARLGALTEIGTIGGVVDWPQSVAVDPAGAFVYAANFGRRTVAAFKIKATGDLEYLGEATAGNQPLSVAVGSVQTGAGTRGYAFAAGFASGGLTAFSIDPTTGALTAVGNEIQAGTAPRSTAVDPKSRYVYVANRGTPDQPESHSVAMFRITPTTGALTAPASGAKALQATGSAPEWVTVDPTGRYLYVADPGAHSISMFPIDQTTGELGAEVAVAAGDQPVTVTVDPTGRFAYVVDFASDQVTTFSIDQATGALRATGDVVETGDQPYGMAVVAF